jgi:hypothetical protein
MVPMPHLVDFDLPGDSPAKQMLALACSYADAAQCVCIALVSGSLDQNGGSVRVIFHLCRHATELFLKGAVGLKTGGQFPRTHKLDVLYSEYMRRYVFQEFELDVPFGIWTLTGVDFHDIEELFGESPFGDRSVLETHDQRFRYPVDNRGRQFSEQAPFDLKTDPQQVAAFAQTIRHLSATVQALSL